MSPHEHHQHENALSPSLRERAKARAARAEADLAGLPTEDVQALVYELRVRQAELEIQNEDLRQAYLELADARDRYLDLYEFAPVGYATLDRQHAIRDANLTLAVLLRVERRELLGRRFEQLVPAEHRDACYLFLRTARERRGGTALTFEVPLAVESDHRLFARMEIRRPENAPPADELRVAVLDTTERYTSASQRKRLIAELRAATNEQHKLIGALRAQADRDSALENLLHLCAECRRVRTEAGDWQRLDIFITERTDVLFSHGLCPDCLYPKESGSFR